MSKRQYRPVISSQNYRAINALLQAACRFLGLEESDLFPLYSVRLTQLGVGTHRELLNLTADAAFYERIGADQFSPIPTLIVIIDKQWAEYRRALEWLDGSGLPYIFCSAADALARPRAQIPREVKMEITTDRQPFLRYERKVLGSLLGALQRLGLADTALVTGQVTLGAFSDFRGYSHHPSKPQTDVDILICTPPPVCFPVMAIEVDGPHHYSAEQVFNEASPEEARERLAKELAKKIEKDKAFESAGVPVFRMRVNSSIEAILNRTIAFVTEAIAHCAYYLIQSGDVLEKKQDWIRSTVANIRSTILEGDETEAFISKNPEVEDAFFTLSELCDSYLQELERMRGAAREYPYPWEGLEIDEDDPNIAADSQYQNLMQIDFLNSAPWKSDLLTHFAVVGQIETIPDDEVRKRILIGVNIRSAKPSFFSVFGFTELVPWIEFKGSESEELTSVFEDRLAQRFAISKLASLDKREQSEIRARAIRYLEAENDARQQRQALAEIAWQMNHGGVRKIIGDLETRSATLIRSVLVSTGVISLVGDGAVGDRVHWLWKWSDKGHLAPEWWDEEGEKLMSLEKACAAACAASDSVKKRARDKIEEWTQKRVHFLEAANVEPCCVDEFIKAKDKIVQRLSKF